MNVLYIISNNEEIIRSAGKLLYEKRLAVDINIERNLERLTVENGEVVLRPIICLSAKAKALLFNTIDQVINKAFPENTPEIFSVPIVNMDWSQMQEHIKTLEQI